MPISVICSMCDKELDEPGALILSPPTPQSPHLVEKAHVCVNCWNICFWVPPQEGNDSNE